MKKEIQSKLEELANLCLENSGKYEGYSDVDLFNATSIFADILLDVTCSSNKDLPIDVQSKLVETIGKALRELILASTGKDMHVIVRELLNKTL